MSRVRNTTFGCKTASHLPMRGRVRRFARTRRRRAYAPPEPVEPGPWPWSGGAGLGWDGAGPELDGAAGAGDAGFGAMWLAGAAGALGRGVIEDVPPWAGVGEGDDGPED